MTPEQEQLLFRYLGQHFVGLCGVFKIGASEQRRSFCASGVVIELDGDWYLVTAGHVLKGIEGRIGQGWSLEHCSIADYFGLNAKSQNPTVISYDGTKKYAEDDEVTGIDLGVLKLCDLYVSGLQANGVSPIPESHWIDGEKQTEQTFTVLGFPEEEIQLEENGVSGTVRPCLAGLTPCSAPEHTPTWEYPRFVAKLNSDEPDSMLGFSGGPIFRIAKRNNGVSCWLQAIEGGWWKDRRTVYGCPMHVATERIREHFKRND